MSKLLHVHITLHLILGYLAVGGIWGALLDFLAAGGSNATINNLKGQPPGGMAGEILLWPWGIASWAYTLATGTSS